jgi:hypothetical protein
MSDGFEPNQLELTLCSLVGEAIALEKNYKGMLMQGDEVDHRIQLWRDAVEICKIEPESM